ncbi:hypothetical protein D3C81_612390 [compost metagenome]
MLLRCDGIGYAIAEKFIKESWDFKRTYHGADGYRAQHFSGVLKLKGRGFDTALSANDSVYVLYKMTNDLPFAAQVFR